MFFVLHDTYGFRDIHKPMGVAAYETKIVSSLPKKLKGTLPTIEEIEAEPQLEGRQSREYVTRKEGNKRL